MSHGLHSSSLELISENAEELSDVEPLRFNVGAAKAVAEAVRTTLGPKGMDKMLVDSAGDIVVTNDGATILNEMEIVHPAAQLVVEVAKAQEERIGDGTTASVVFAGELLRHAEELLEKGLHPTSVVSGYITARNYVREELNDLRVSVGADDRELLRSVADTSLTGRGTDVDRALVSGLVVDAVRHVASDDTIDLKKINIKSQTGRGWRDSELFEGAAFRKEPVFDDMPTEFDHARILLLDEPITVEDVDPDRTLQYQFDNPDDRRRAVEDEEEQVRRKAEMVIGSGADVVFCRWDIDKRAKHALANAGMLAVERVLKTDLLHLTDVLGAPIVEDIENITAMDVGFGDISRDEDDGMFFVEGGSLKSVTLILRGSIEHATNEYERSVNDAIHSVSEAMTRGEVVPGGGALEAELARRLRRRGASVSGHRQLAVGAFADALEVIPRSLAKNAGFDPIDALVDLRTAHRTSARAGFDAYTGEVVDAMKAGIVEPAVVKEGALDSATDAATLMLRIDDVLAGASDPDDVPGEMMAGRGHPDGPDHGQPNGPSPDQPDVPDLP